MKTSLPLISEYILENYGREDIDLFISCEDGPIDEVVEELDTDEMDTIRNVLEHEMNLDDKREIEDFNSITKKL